MYKMTANQAKQNFGELLDKAQAGPVEITKHGRRVGVLVSDEWFSFDEFKKRRDFEKRLEESMKQVERGEVYTLDEVRQEMREKIENWSQEIDEKS